MSDVEPDVTDQPTDQPTDQDQDTGAAEGEQPGLTEDDYARGETSDPDGASRDEPAGEDYAGSGF